MEKMIEQLGKKMSRYLHWLDSKKQGDKLKDFAESKELVFLLADIIQNDNWEDYPNLKSSYNNPYVGYSVAIHILLQYIISEMDGYEDVLSSLEEVTNKAVDTVMSDEPDDNRAYMLVHIYNSYKKQKAFQLV
ncbi:MAG: hypothetical protein FWC69_01885 [Defluviitaleaceae bacterium]|nr:hypothetical protein [Defluviitaleaceae bacterium]